MPLEAGGRGEVMSPAELAALLDGREIRSETTRTERRAAAAAGLVIIYGASDEAASDSAGTLAR